MLILFNHTSPSLVSSIFTVTYTHLHQGFSVNVSSDGPWSQTPSVDWTAWDASAGSSLPFGFSQGMASSTISKDGNTARFSFSFSPALPVLDPIVIVSPVSPRHPVAVTVVSVSPTELEINAVCMKCNFKSGETLSFNWLAFVREYFGANVTNGPLAAVQSVTGPLVNEVWQTFRNKYATQTLRLYRGVQSQDDAVVEVVNDIGPLDKGRELVTRFHTSLETSSSSTTGTFYTDDNGLEMLKRTYNLVTDEPVAGNYFPASSRAILKENDESQQFTVVMTSSHGCGSTASGHIELMLHRRCLKDDGYGVGEVRLLLSLSYTPFQFYPFLTFPVCLGISFLSVSEKPVCPALVLLLCFYSFASPLS